MVHNMPISDKSYEEEPDRTQKFLRDLGIVFDRGNEKEKTYVCNVCKVEIKPVAPILFDTAPVCQKCANEGYF